MYKIGIRSQNELCAKESYAIMFFEGRSAAIAGSKGNDKSFGTKINPSIIGIIASIVINSLSLSNLL